MAGIRRPTLRLLILVLGWALAPCSGTAAAHLERSSALAQQAYERLTHKDYTAAIELFRKALAAEADNLSLRKDLAFTYEQTGALPKAAEQFEIILRARPDDFNTALNLGFLYSRMGRNDGALKCFEVARKSPEPNISSRAAKAEENLRAEAAWNLRAQGYRYIREGRQRAAIQTFEQIYSQNPQDYAAAMQLGYLYQAAGQHANARLMFRSAADSPDSGIAQQAQTALRSIDGTGGPYFYDFYFAPYYMTRFGNEINTFNAKLGLRPRRYFQPYVGLRINRDTRSQTGAVPIIFSDDTAVFSVGIQSQPFGPNSRIYAEAGSAVALLNHPTGGRAIPDYRVGMNCFHGWGLSLARAVHESSRRAALFGEAYGDAGYYSRYGNNVIGYIQIKQGLTFTFHRLVPAQLFASVNVAKDSQGDFYNNITEFGPGFRFAPWRRLPALQLQAEFLRGYYMEKGSRTVNPYGPNYNDGRFFIIWQKYF